MTAARKTAAALAALTMGITLAATSTPAEARYGRNAALFGALAAGALVAGAIGAGAYASPAYGGCYVERQAVTNRWGDVVGYRRVRVCD